MRPPRQAGLSEFESPEDPLGALTQAEREAWEQVEQGELGPREFARETERSPGTVGNLLQRAREKLSS